MTLKVDCDVHPMLRETRALLPFLDEYWSEQIGIRGIDKLELTSYAPGLPTSCRADWRASLERAGAGPTAVQELVLDDLQTDFAICNVLYGSSAAFNPYFASALCRATNDWLESEWLDRDSRLLGSVVVPMTHPDAGAEEIKRLASHPKFVQVLLLASAEMPLGHRFYWPMYRAAEEAGMPVAIHPGGAARFAPTLIGWPSHNAEDDAAQALTIQGQLSSMIFEGVFGEFPELRVVLLESGVTWLPAFLSRANGRWKALRMEVPWLKRAPGEIVRERVSLTAQPFDAPNDPVAVARIVSHLGADGMLLYASDFPHSHFHGRQAIPEGFPDKLRQAMSWANPLSAYPRLKEAVR
jgi:predicted TIM-barrel fold metal-dependent hydrolase